MTRPANADKTGAHGDRPHEADREADATTCPRCGESHELAKVKGCVTCLHCGFKFDCNGW